MMVTVIIACVSLMTGIFVAIGTDNLALGAATFLFQAVLMLILDEINERLIKLNEHLEAEKNPEPKAKKEKVLYNDKGEKINLTT